MKNWVDFRAVKQAVSLEAVLLHYQVPGLRRRRNQLVGCCPIHSGQRADSFRATLSKNAFYCFACQAHGNVLDFVAAMERCSLRAAALRLQQWFDVSVPSDSSMALLPLDMSRMGEGELVRKKEERNPPLRFALRMWIRLTPTWQSAESTGLRLSSLAWVSMAAPVYCVSALSSPFAMHADRSSPMPVVR